MKSIGFIISNKDHEKRRAILPKDLSKIKNVEYLFFEENYGESIGISDKEYLQKGVNIAKRQQILECDILVDVKIGDSDYLDQIADNKILVGWAHSVQKIGFTSKAINHCHTVIAWENIYENGRYIFYKNREIAGEAAVLQAYPYCGKMPYDTKVAIIGNGQTAKGAMRVLVPLGADVDVYPRKLEEAFKENMFNYDVIVNCVLWDVNRNDHIIYYSDLPKFKKGTMIIDVSCDPHLGIESSHPTSIDNPIYILDGVIHYAVDNTPAMYPYTVSNFISNKFSEYVDYLIEDNYPDNLKKAIDIENGIILNETIINYRKKLSL